MLKSYCYFIKLSLAGGESLSLGNTMVLKDITNGSNVETVPAEILGEDVQISISFEAVQKANEAFKYEFETTPADKKGYYSEWE